MTAARMSRWLVMAWLLLAAALVHAAPKAWLDRNRIALGETVTLNIATTETAAPEFGPLEGDFAPHGHTSERRFELVNGQATMRSLYSVALRPAQAGRVTIPPIRVGNTVTAPLVLEVTPAAQAIPARAGDDVFIESGPDDLDPYVQQAVGWVVRLYSAIPLVSGHLDQAAPAGASMQRIGDDAQYTRELGGRRYTVVERRYLLVPERSGELAVPGAVFEGRGVGGMFDSLFGDRGGELRARAAPRVLSVQPVPAGAPQPWLPLHDLRLRYTTTPTQPQAGRAATLAVELVADGALAAQLPELELPAIDGVQVFAEPPQSDERFVDGRPQVTLTRRFSLVPSQAGPVRLPGLRLPWWDIAGGAVRTATLPALDWQVRPGSAAAAATAGQGASDPPVAGSAAPGQATTDRQRIWVAIALAFAGLWLLTLVWAVHRRGQRAGSGVAPAAGSDTATKSTAVATPAKPGLAQLRRAIDAGGPEEIVAILQAMADPPIERVDALQSRLDDEAQREALDALQRARWGGGDVSAARQAVRAAFAKGPRWAASQTPAKPPLPPLYPER
ncbi:BatD family protein [Lysobacter korlensis]|uniref:BatD family protein n=1 Tax=Lysobacter korlensis TaxID=553636 RepID=A0ABV6RJP6_9GAMM